MSEGHLDARPEGLPPESQMWLADLGLAVHKFGLAVRGLSVLLPLLLTPDPPPCHVHRALARGAAYARRRR